jgi:hypothetical protein
MKFTADDGNVLVGDEKGYLKLISLTDGQVIKDFGIVHDFITIGIMITEDQKFFLTSSFYGELKQWNYEDNTLAKDHGKITNRIMSLSL